jgi:hypothetical protein
VKEIVVPVYVQAEASATVRDPLLALEFPWDKWTIFLHPEQRQWVERDFAGPARVSGSPGPGKRSSPWAAS